MHEPPRLKHNNREASARLPDANALDDHEEALFRDRVPEAAARQLATVLAWLTECQLATLEDMEARERTPKSLHARQAKICETAVRHCKELGVAPIGLEGRPCSRLRGQLAAYAVSAST